MYIPNAPFHKRAYKKKSDILFFPKISTDGYVSISSLLLKVNFNTYIY